MRSSHQVSLAALCLASFLTSGCQRVDGENDGIPAKPEDLKENLNTDQSIARDKWIALADTLKIGRNTALSELSVPSTDATDATFAEAMTKLHLAQGAYKSRCASVDSFKVTSPVTPSGTGLSTGFNEKYEALDAHVYVMTYRLQKNLAGDPEDTARHGLVVVPKAPKTTSGKAVLAMYAHDAAHGLSYLEIAKTFASMQLQHVIAAPSYPGEPLCAIAPDLSNAAACAGEKRLADAVGTSDVYNADVDDLLGMHDCLFRAAIDKVDPGVSGKYAAGTQIGSLALKDQTTETDTTLGALMASKVASIGGTMPSGTGNFLPKSILVGNGRGALVAQLAAARAGAHLSTISAASANTSTLAASMGAKYFSNITSGASTKSDIPFASLFSCKLSLGTAFGYTAGVNRLMLQAMIEGSTFVNGAIDFSQIPGIANFNANIVAPYRAETADAAATAQAIRLRDASFNAILSQIALRNWGKYNSTAATAGGADLYVHGLEDSVFAYTNTQLLHNIQLAIYAKTAATASRKIPGTKPKTRIVSATTAFRADEGGLSEGATMHGDDAFAAATSVIIANFVPEASTDQAAVKALDDFHKSELNTAQTPATIVGAWRAGECEAALTP